MPMHLLPCPYPSLSDFVKSEQDAGRIPVSIQQFHPKEPHAGLFSAFPAEGELVLQLCVSASLAPYGAKLHLFDDGSGETTEIDGIPYFSEDAYSEDHFRFVLSPEILTKGRGNGLFYYHFTLQSLYGELTVCQNEWEGGCLLSPDAESFSRFQLLLYDPSFYTPDRLKGGIMYQIFVDRFRKCGNPPLKEGAKLCEDWENGIPEYPEKNGDPLANNLFFGGTLDGILEKLDELLLLGVNCLYLTPIFEARSNHKYDTGDYEKVDEMFGGEEALRRLLAGAKERGITVILDGVFNHTGDDSRYFNRCGRYDSVGACQSKESPYYRWYHFTKHPEQYDSWWGIEILPRVHSDDPTFIDFLCGEGGVLQKYLRMGAGGFRLDVADELEEPLLLAIRERLREEDPQGVLYGEVWEDASNKIAYGKRRSYFRGKMLDSVMNYPLKNALVEYILHGDSAFLSFTMRTLYSHYPKPSSDILMNLLGTHDTERILTVLAGSPLAGESNVCLAKNGYFSEKEKLPHLPKLMLAYAMLCFLPGIPCIYYGDEAGMDGYHDPFNRRPYPWGRELKPLQRFYREMGRLRRAEPLLRSGYYRELSHMGAGFAFERFSDTRRIIFLANSGSTPVTFSLKEEMYMYTYADPLFDRESSMDFSDRKRVYGQVIVSPVSFVILYSVEDDSCDPDSPENPSALPSTPDKD